MNTEILETCQGKSGQNKESFHCLERGEAPLDLLWSNSALLQNQHSHDKENYEPNRKVKPQKKYKAKPISAKSIGTRLHDKKTIYQREWELRQPKMCGNWYFVNKHGDKVVFECNTWSCSKCSTKKAKRLRSMVYELCDKYELNTMLTLTLRPKGMYQKGYTDEQKNEFLKKSWDNLRRRISHKYGSFNYIWILEFQKNGFPHLHVCLDVEKVDMKLLTKQWKRLTGAWQISIDYKCSKSESENLFKHYISKYLSKEACLTTVRFMGDKGRIWGRSRKIKTGYEVEKKRRVVIDNLKTIADECIDELFVIEYCEGKGEEILSAQTYDEVREIEKSVNRFAQACELIDEDVDTKKLKGRIVPKFVLSKKSRWVYDSGIGEVECWKKSVKEVVVEYSVQELSEFNWLKKIWEKGERMDE